VDSSLAPLEDNIFRQRRSLTTYSLPRRPTSWPPIEDRTCRPVDPQLRDGRPVDLPWTTRREPVDPLWRGCLSTTGPDVGGAQGARGVDFHQVPRRAASEMGRGPARARRRTFFLICHTKKIHFATFSGDNWYFCEKKTDSRSVGIWKGKSVRAPAELRPCGA